MLYGKGEVQGDAISLKKILSLPLTMLAKKKESTTGADLRRLPGLEFISHLKGMAYNRALHLALHYTVLEIYTAEKRECT